MPSVDDVLVSLIVVGFLGWLTILHYGPNQQLYPFFAFDSPVDPYTYKLTLVASSVIWASELVSSFLARGLIAFTYTIDVTNVGLDQFREHVSGRRRSNLELRY